MDLVSSLEETSSTPSVWRRVRNWCANYEPRHLSLLQKCVGVLALIALFHFAIGLYLWGLMIYSQTYSLIRTSRPGLFWWNLWTWLPFFARSLKSLLPFEAALLAIYLLPHRVKAAAGLVGGIIVFSVVCAWYDISREEWDIATFGPPWGGHMNLYLTWWWCRQRPK